MRWEGPGYSELEYNSVRKRELMRVDFPRPDSPAELDEKEEISTCITDIWISSVDNCKGQASIIVKVKV